METPCDRDDIVLSALKRHKIVASNLKVHDDGGEAVLAFSLLGVRRLRRQGSLHRDDTAELKRRLYGIFPGMNDLNIKVEAMTQGRRWNRTVQFRMACEELEYMVNLQPAEC